MIYECVINISEGSDSSRISEIVSSATKTLCDISSDIDHNRSVITLASTNLDDIVSSAKDVVSSAYCALDIKNHNGVHPRLGSVDVCPFISYDENNFCPTPAVIKASHEFGQWVYSTFNVPIFFYDFASDTNTTLPQIRKQAYRSISPSLGSAPDVKHGSMCVGARCTLIAFNVNIISGPISLAKQIAAAIRESSGGVKGVRAIGLELTSIGSSQVSMNIIDPHVDLSSLCETVRKMSSGFETHAELIGLMPKFVFDKLDKKFLDWSGLDDDLTIESRLNKII